MVAGKIFVPVEKSGSETTSAKISQILNDTAGYKLASQHGGGAGRQGRDPDPGDRARSAWPRSGSAAPSPSSTATSAPASAWPRRSAMLTSLALCAQQGHPGQGRPGARADERDRHRPLRQDRHAHARAPRGRPRDRLRRGSTRPRSSGTPRPPSRSSPSDRPGDPRQGPRRCGLAAAADRRLEVPGRLRHHGPRRRAHGARGQHAVHGDGGHRPSRDRSSVRWTRPTPRATRWSWWRPTTRSAAPSSCTRRTGPRSARSSPGSASAGSSTSRSSPATTRGRPASWPSRSAWTATSPRSCRPTRPTTSRSSRRKGGRSASSATASTTRSP